MADLNLSALSSLTAISPLDGRYGEKLNPLRAIFSEYALIKYRLEVEVRWFEFLCAEKVCPLQLSAKQTQALHQIYQNFNVAKAQEVKTIEQTTNHDVKAVEYFLVEQFKTIDDALYQNRSFIHFCLTSEDINNLSYALMLRDYQKMWCHQSSRLIDALSQMAKDYAHQAILSLTHGQSASPTTLGKELANFAYRLAKIQAHTQTITFGAKCNGAVGNFNAQHIALKQVDWQRLSERFIQTLQLQYNPYTTQIEPHDDLVAFLDGMKRFQSVLIDLCQDTWGYISRGIFSQKWKKGEVGSSTMPHKINPIDFENAEGNLVLSNGLLETLARKLPISRFQRDLTDSTTLRNLGVGLGHGYLAFLSLEKGLAKLDVNSEVADKQLSEASEVLTEAIQTLLRLNAHPNPYEEMKQLSRGQSITLESLHDYIQQSSSLNTEQKQALLNLKPQTYTGLAPLLALEIDEHIAKVLKDTKKC